MYFRSRLVPVLVFCVVGLIGFLRSSAAFLQPIMFAEDGFLLFAFDYTHGRDVSAIFRFYAGYISLLPQIVAFLAGYVAKPLVPYVYAFSALALNTLTFTVFSFSRFRTIIKGDWMRAGICIAMALFPIGSSCTVSTCMFMLWNGLILLVLLTCAPLPRTILGRLLQCLGMVVLVWSNPLSVVCVPLILWQLRRGSDSQEITVYVILIVACLAYQFLGVSHETDYGRSLVGRVYPFLTLLLERVVFETFFDGYLRLWLRDLNLAPLVWGFSVTIIMATVLVLLRNRRAGTHLPYEFLCLCAFVVIAVAFGTIVGRSAGTWLVAEIVDETVQRYYYVPRFFFLLLELILICSLVPLNRSIGIKGLFAICIVGIYLAVFNIENSFLYATSYDEGQRVASFIQQLEERRRYGGGDREEEFVLPRHGHTIRIRIPGTMR